MAKKTSTPNKKLPKPSSTPVGAADEAQPYCDVPNARFAPYDNLWDAIRADVAEYGGGAEIGRREWCVAINAINDYTDGMASMMIRKLDETVKKRLRMRAAENGRSLEAEVRDILVREANGKSSPTVNLGEAIRRRFAPFGGVELEPFPDEVLRDPPALRRARRGK